MEWKTASVRLLWSLEMVIGITPHGHGATEPQIVEIESKVDARLPEDYREFLMRNNGGRPRRSSATEYAAFRVVWPSHSKLEEVGAQGLLAFLYTADKSSGVSWHEAYWGLVELEQRIPPDTIPIGHDPGSNEILLAVKGANRGKVFFWLKDYASPDDDAEPTYDNVGFVANSFTEFLDGLYPWKEDSK